MLVIKYYLLQIKIQIYLENTDTISSLKNTNQDVLRSGTSVSHKILPVANFKNFYGIVKKVLVQWWQIANFPFVQKVTLIMNFGRV